MKRYCVGDAAGAREYSGEVGVVEAFVRLVRPALEALQRARPVDVHQGEEGLDGHAAVWVVCDDLAERLDVGGVSQSAHASEREAERLAWCSLDALAGERETGLG